MLHNLKNNKGNIIILLCMGLPLLIAIAGMCIDGGLLMYYEAKLMAATKLAAISASSHYTANEGKVIINGKESDADEVLSKNFNGAKIQDSGFILDGNKVTVNTEVKIDFAFMKIFNINNTIIHESYTVTRQ